MSYFSELSEKLFIRNVNWLKKQQKGNPVSRDLGRSVFYEEDAYKALRYWVNRIGPEQLHAESYDRKSNLLRLVCDSHNIFYWVYYSDGLYYAVRIGPKSKLYVGRTSYVPYCDMAKRHNDVEVEIADNLLLKGEYLSLSAKFVYDEQGLRPFLLVIKGGFVSNINKAPWNAEVDIHDPEALRAKHYDVMGRQGFWYDFWYNEIDDETYRGKQKPDDSCAWIHEKRWAGEKIICQFLPTERPSVSKMLEIWKNFFTNLD